MRIGINIDGQFGVMTGVQHSLDALINALYCYQAQHPAQTPHEIFAFASLEDASAMDALVQKNPGVFAWRDLPQARFDTSRPAPTLLTAAFRRKHPWVSQKIRDKERKLWNKRPGGSHLRASRYDVFHNALPGPPDFFAYKPKKQVATLYDTAMLRFPDRYPAHAAKVWTDYWDYATKKADHFIAISEFSKNEAVEMLHINEDRFTVTPLAARISTAYMGDTLERRALLEKWEVAGTPFVLYTGTLEPRKNLTRLVSAFADVAHQNLGLPHKLVLAGSSWLDTGSFLEAKARECGISERVVFTGYVRNDELNALMSACTAFVFVSEYEGFGMPPLEAMVCGAPVVAANTTSLPEVMGNAGILVDPQSTEEIAAALFTLISDPAENTRQRNLSRVRAQAFGWEHTAALTLQAYEKTAAS